MQLSVLVRPEQQFIQNIFEINCQLILDPIHFKSPVSLGILSRGTMNRLKSSITQRDYASFEQASAVIDRS